MFVEVNTSDAAERGIKTAAGSGSTARKTARRRVKALVTIASGRACIHAVPLRRLVPGVDQRGKYPKGADPIVLGESVNTITSYGYDPVTGMHEGKVTLCQIQSA